MAQKLNISGMGSGNGEDYGDRWGKVISKHSIYLRYYTANVPCAENSRNSLLETVAVVTHMTLTTSAFLTLRHIVFRKETEIFSKLSNLAHIVKWLANNIRRMFGKQYVYQDQSYYSIVESFARSENDVPAPGFIV